MSTHLTAPASRPATRPRLRRPLWVLALAGAVLCPAGARAEPPAGPGRVNPFTGRPTPAPDPRKAEDADDLRWAQDIVLRPMFEFDPTETGTLKWAVAPKVAVFGGTKAQQKVVEEMVQHLNKTFRHTSLSRIELLPPNSPGATLGVHFVRRTAIPAKAAQLGTDKRSVKSLKERKADRDCGMYMSVNKKYTIDGGFVILSTDKEDSGRLKHNLLRNLCWDLGFANESNREPKSVFYLEGAVESSAEELSAKDRQLVIWFYDHVPAGTDSLKSLYDAHWRKSAP